MRCAKSKKLISEFIDGELDAARGSRLQRHLDSCPDCRKFKCEFEKIALQAGELKAAVPRELTWTRLASRLAVPARKPLAKKFVMWRLSPRMAFSGAFLLAIVIGTVVVAPSLWRPRAFLLVEDSRDYALAKLDEAEQHYQMAIRALGEAARSREEDLDPKIAEVFRSNLKIIDISIAACKQAVLSEPDNIDSRKFLLAVYEEKTELLESLMSILPTTSLKQDFGETI